MAEPEESARRKFVFAPRMELLRDRVQEAEDLANKATDAVGEAEAILEEIEASDDLKERLASVLFALADHARGIVTLDEVYEIAGRARENVEWPDWVGAALHGTETPVPA